MEDIFSPKAILKPNTSLLESLPLFSSSWEISTINHLPGKYPFPLPRNWFPLLGNLNCYQVNTIFHFRGIRFHFLGNLNYYLLPGKYHVQLPGNSFSTSWEISIITFYPVNTTFHFRGTRFHFLGNLNYYLLPGKYHVPLPGNSFPLHGKSQFLPFTR